MKLQWVEARRLGRNWVGWTESCKRTDPFARPARPFKPRGNLGFDVPLQFLHNDELFRMMHAQDWDLAAR